MLRPAPGIAVTVYPCTRERLEAALPLLIALRPPIVQLHTQPDAPDEPLLRELRAALPGVRVWMGAGANGLAAGDLAADLRTAREWASWCAARSVELLVFNCEGDHDPKTTDWLIDEPGEEIALADRMAQVLRTAHEAAPSLALGFTSHDRVRTWRLPWGAALGRARPSWSTPIRCTPPSRSTPRARSLAKARSRGSTAPTNSSLRSCDAGRFAQTSVSMVRDARSTRSFGA